MAGPSQADTRNLILSRLDPDDFERLRPHLVLATSRRGDIMLRPGQVIQHCWFPEAGIASLIAVSPEGHRVEAGLQGRDSVSPVAIALGVDRFPHELTIQVEGNAWQIPADEMRAAMADRPGLHARMMLYAQAFAVQTSFTALSNAVHSLPERCARWILMCHDRVDGDDIPITHDFMSLMLAVRRPSITTALHVLEGNRFIRAERGWITVRDRTALEDFAHDAYGVPEAEYERLLGPLRHVAPIGAAPLVPTYARPAA